MAGTVAGTTVAGILVETFKDAKRGVGELVSRYENACALERNHDKLMEEVEKLRARRADIEAEVNSNKSMQATQECHNWILSVNKIEEEVLQLKGEYNEGKDSRNIFSKETLSERFTEKIAEVHNLWIEGNLERGVVAAKPPNPVEKMGARNIEDKQSLHRVVQETLDWLRRDEIRRIGIWGIVGIGKTTIMENLNDNEDIAEMFDFIISLNVLKNPNVEKLQEAIIQRLKLNMEGNISTIQGNAWRISEELVGKKCLILLDEVGHKIDLHEIMRFRTLENDSKVVLASRSRKICCDMHANKLIEVKYLSDADAWNMFKEIVGDAAISNSSIKKIAELVVKECGRLPLLIDKVASTFKEYKDDDLWDEGFKRLQRWHCIPLEGTNEVLQVLEQCYNDLNETRRACFMYGALYPEECEIYIDYLLECWRAEGFMNHTNEFQDARGIGHVILKELINRSLLERCYKRKRVQMNKVLRKLALRMSSERNDFKLLVKPRERLQKFPKKSEWEKATRISLMDNQLTTLPDTLDCCNLLTLLLQRNKCLKAIPESLFASMVSLRVLDLHGTGIESLPSSLSNLIHLRVLYLNSCINLMEFQFAIEALVNLELLDVRGTIINLQEIGSLEKVKCLRISLSNFGMGNQIEGMKNLIKKKVSSFSSLEEFSIDVDSSEQWWDKIVETIKEEVATLEKLTTLQFCFPEGDCLELFVTTSPVWKEDSCLTFQFANRHPDSTSPQILESFCYASNNCLKLVDENGVDPIILMEAYAFGLINHKGVSRLSDFGMENMDKMLVCLIEGCNEIETIINGNGITQGVLKCLEQLCINNVLKLESIWQGPVYGGSLAQLKNLTLSKCPELKKIFSDGLIEQLPQLQYLRVEECHQIEEIIMESENNGLKANALPKLKTLILLDLPKLTSIWVDDSLEWPSLQWIKIFMCDMLRRLPFNIANATNLRFIEGQKSWWGAIVWNNDAVKQRVLSLASSTS